MGYFSIDFFCNFIPLKRSKSCFRLVKNQKVRKLNTGVK